jgi:hypothetical protein
MNHPWLTPPVLPARISPAGTRQGSTLGFVIFTHGANGHGYWLIAANGAVSNYGDAAFYGSATVTFQAGTVDVTVTTPSGTAIIPAAFTYEGTGS